MLPPFRGARRAPLQVEERFWNAQWRRRTRTAGRDLRSRFRKGAAGPVTFDQPEVPLAGVHLAAIAREAGCSVGFLDLWDAGRAVVDRDFVRRELEAMPSGVFLFSCFTNNYSSARECAQVCREVYPDATLVIGGAHVTGWPAEALEDGFDLVVRGEGDAAIAHLARNAFRRDAWGDAPGALFRDESGPNTLSRAEFGRNLQPLPLPAYDLLPPRYRATYYARLFTAHGCPFRCTFCSDVLWTGMNPRIKPMSRIQAELELLQQHVQFDEIYVSDETFTVRHDHALASAELLHESGVRWGCETRADLLDHALTNQLSRFGCVEIDFGVESLADEVLRNARKRIFLPQVERTLSETTEAGIRTHVNLMIGLPGETDRTARETIGTVCRWLEKGIVDTVDYFVTVPYPGSEIFDKPDNFGIRLRTQDWSRYREDDIPVYDLPTLAAEEIFDLWCEGLGRLAESMESGDVE